MYRLIHRHPHLNHMKLCERVWDCVCVCVRGAYMWLRTLQCWASCRRVTQQLMGEGVENEREGQRGGGGGGSGMKECRVGESDTELLWTQAGANSPDTLIHLHTQTHSACCCGVSPERCVSCQCVCAWLSPTRTTILRSITLTPTTMKSQRRTRQSVSVARCVCVRARTCVWYQQGHYGNYWWPWWPPGSVLREHLQ